MLDASLSPCCRSHPAGGHPSRHPDCDGLCRLRQLGTCSASGCYAFSGLPLRSLSLRPGDSLTIRRWLRRWASGVRFPSPLPSKLRGVWLLPRRVCLPLNTSAFLDITPSHATHLACRRPRLPPRDQPRAPALQISSPKYVPPDPLPSRPHVRVRGESRPKRQRAQSETPLQTPRRDGAATRLQRA